MTDKKKDNTPQIIKRLLSKFEDSEEEAFDCINCGGTFSVFLIEDHDFIDEKLKLSFQIPTYICRVCGDESYSSKSFEHILQKKENASGRDYIKVNIKNGKIIKVSIH